MVNRRGDSDETEDLALGSGLGMIFDFISQEKRKVRHD